MCQTFLLQVLGTDSNRADGADRAGLDFRLADPMRQRRRPTLDAIAALEPDSQRAFRTLRQLRRESLRKRDQIFFSVEHASRAHNLIAVDQGSFHQGIYISASGGTLREAAQKARLGVERDQSDRVS